MKKEILQRHKYCLEFLPSCSKLLLKYFHKKGLQVDKKGKNDLVTEADKASEKYIIQKILSQFPEDCILGEEGGEKKGNSPYQWIIDPLDGTTNFSHRIPLYAISIAIFHLERNQVLSGVVCLPSLGNTYYALRGKGAFKDKKKIQVSTSNQIIDFLFCTGFPYKKTEQDVERILVQLKAFLIKGRGVRRTGAAALDLCWLAEGKFDAFWEESLAAWDMAAGAILVEEAGGKVTSFAGNPFHPSNPNILASNGKIHKKLLEEFIPENYINFS